MTDFPKVEFSWQFGFFDIEAHEQDEARFESERDRLWAILFTATDRSLFLVDVFGRKHAVKPDEGIVCPNLTDSRNSTTASFLKAAMLRAVVLQLSHVSTLNVEEETKLCEEAMEIARLVDSATINSSPFAVLKNLRASFKEVHDMWSTILVHEGHATLPETALEGDVAFIPQSASGLVRTRLLRLIRGIRRSKIGPQGEPTVAEVDSMSIEAYATRWSAHDDLSAAKGVPSFQGDLLAYSEALRVDQNLPVSRRTGATHLVNLRATMIVAHAIINAQLLPIPEQIFQPGECGGLVLAAGVTGLVVGSALWWTGFGLILGISSYFMLTMTGVALEEVFQPTTPTVFYAQLLKAALDRLALHAPAPLVSRTAETLLAPLERLAPAEIAAQVTDASKTAWRFKLQPSIGFYRWILIVATIGQLRLSAPRMSLVGTVGPVRIGKSRCLTRLFGLAQAIFAHGGGNASRTMEIRVHKVASALVVDCPGLDEMDAQLRQATSMATELLDVIIVVVNYSMVDATGTGTQLQLLARLLLERNGQPVCILLNRVDEAISKNTSDRPDYWLEDARQRKALFISHLRNHLGGQTHLDSHIATTHPTQPNLQFVRRARLPLDEIVHPSCLIDIDDVEEITPFKRDILRHLQRQGMLWDETNVKEWAGRVCPEAFNQA